MTTTVPPFVTFRLGPEHIADLRSDHAGEHGAVAIYCGILFVSRDPGVRCFARRHLRCELRHRRFLATWLPKRFHSRLLPLWWAAGWSLGAISALFGPDSVFRTIAAVETFVEQHYVEQIESMRKVSRLESLADKLQAFCDDEVMHQHDAEQRLQGPSTAIGRLWSTTVGVGSSLGVAVARRL